MKRYVENRRLGSDTLRSLCIKKRWYTSGDIAAYDNLLNMAKDYKGDFGDVIKMAADIIAHTNYLNERDMVEVMEAIMEEVWTYIIEVDDDE